MARALAALLALGLAAPGPLREQDEGFDRKLQSLQGMLTGFRSDVLSPDVEIFAKGIAWGLRYDPKLSLADRNLVHRAIERGLERTAALSTGRHPWTDRKGRVVRGYRSAVDGSVQPMGLIIPRGYDPARPIRLDVVLHGSSKPVGMSELRFMARFDEGDQEGKPPPEADWIELHPLGRVENCYRYSGETDVFEAIEAVSRHYAIDRNRIVLRGMSMGASGTWHLGLKHPDRFVAIGPWCGYVDTHHFSETPGMNFLKVGPLPEPQEKMLHFLDSIDYAANAGVVPVVACMGDKDPFFQAHVLMGEAMAREGLDLVNLIAPNTAHAVEPATQMEQLRQLAERAAPGLDRSPRRVRFVTWTLKYSRCHWIEILGLGEHYARAEIEAEARGDRVEVRTLRNITRFAIDRPVRSLTIEGREISLPSPVQGRLTLEVHEKQWTVVPEAPGGGKVPGLQGPIDDAFTDRFLCIRGTGTPWNSAVAAWSEATLRRFAYEWHRYFRGELPIKDDREVTPEDVRRCNLILFGDPGSNPWIAKALPDLPITWSKTELRVGGPAYAAADHAPALIHPNPLMEGKGRYLVLNSGHTFHELELARLNYLLFPRLGDWAVLKVGGEPPANPADPIAEEVRATGLFDESWK
ncbi:MAG TPA: prolyl oligopeptidase family serine peptidase [Planctomycetota bacterium]|nr:prolyl oligopeptidase family serine peptidase [Planctomycetota bacterium]